jgi:anti-sigma-K factor RskA
MKWEDVMEVAPLYVIGALDEKTECDVEVAIRNANQEQRQAIAQWRDMAALLPVALPLQTPPDHIRERLLSRIAEESQQTPIEIAVEDSALQERAEQKVLSFIRPRRAESRAVRWALIAATILLAFASGYLFTQNAGMARKQEALSRERDSLSNELAEWKRQVDGIVSPQTRVILLAGDETPQANAKVFWDMKTRQWTVYVFDLPAPPSDKDYQLWYVTTKEKISATVFRTDSLGRTSLKLTLPQDAAAGLVATAVTLEPKGGSPQPTGKFYLKASV